VRAESHREKSESQAEKEWLFLNGEKAEKSGFGGKIEAAIFSYFQQDTQSPT
jgi:hypothetical protein